MIRLIRIRCGVLISCGHDTPSDRVAVAGQTLYLPLGALYLAVYHAVSCDTPTIRFPFAVTEDDRMPRRCKSILLPKESASSGAEVAMLLHAERPTIRSLIGGAIAVLGAAALAYK